MGHVSELCNSGATVSQDFGGARSVVDGYDIDKARSLLWGQKDDPEEELSESEDTVKPL